MDFLKDEEKMRDYFRISKEEFLKSYSYLKEEEYNATTKALEEIWERFYYEGDDNSYTPSEDEIRAKKTEKARRLFPLEYKSTEGEDINVDEWTLRQMCKKAGELANKYKTFLIEEYKLEREDLQRASYSNTKKKVMDIIVKWKRWNNFIISFEKYA